MENRGSPSLRKKGQPLQAWDVRWWPKWKSFSSEQLSSPSASNIVCVPIELKNWPRCRSRVQGDQFSCKDFTRKTNVATDPLFIPPPWLTRTSAMKTGGRRGWPGFTLTATHCVLAPRQTDLNAIRQENRIHRSPCSAQHSSEPEKSPPLVYSAALQEGFPSGEGQAAPWFCSELSSQGQHSSEGTCCPRGPETLAPGCGPLPGEASSWPGLQLALYTAQTSALCRSEMGAVILPSPSRHGYGGFLPLSDGKSDAYVCSHTLLRLSHQQLSDDTFFLWVNSGNIPTFPYFKKCANVRRKGAWSLANCWMAGIGEEYW